MFQNNYQHPCASHCPNTFSGIYFVWCSFFETLKTTQYKNIRTQTVGTRILNFTPPLYHM